MKGRKRYERESYRYAGGSFSYDWEAFYDGESYQSDAFSDQSDPGEDPMSSLHDVAYHDSHQSSGSSLSFSLSDMSPHDLGAKGEEIARYYLERRGWEILESNWTCPAGEADIIALDQGVCVFVEVKTRLSGSSAQATPEEAVNKAKRDRYRRIAACYLSTHEAHEIRFDVIAITVVGGRTARVHHLVDAFGSDY